ncbi:ATP-binding protein [Bacillus sp. REN16]|uniref:ATP-binding protein n=1 Tax=Bacillus sp. REN16 TaxID=2887296 RepID=UPI001E31552F|nr:ATP-binding protein [Bacillus sp. REN16]MCC3359379.1 ATP-binding protein [Bacillus sp. REN16]
MDNLDYKILVPFEAVYTERNVGLYKNNPYIEALPPLLDRAEVIKMLVSFPDYDEEERILSVAERKLMVQNLFDYYYPTERTLEMYEKITALLCTGYSSRNPLSKKFYQQAKAISKPTNLYPYQINKTKKTSASNNGLAVVGISGIGKTSAIEMVLSLYPQCIMHTEYKGHKCSFVQLVYLKLECPYDGSIQALCRQFFFEITMLFGENSYSYHLRGDMKTKEYLEKMKLVVHQLGLGMLIIDEVQNLREAKGNEREQMLNFFVSLRNELNIPVVLVGTPKTYPILQGDFRNTRRGIGQGGIEWGVLEKDNPYWKRLLRGMWRYQWTNVKTPLTPEIEETFYDECQGITDVLIKLYMMVQLRAMDKKDETITTELIQNTAKKDFALIQPMINAIRKTDLEAFSRFEDIRPPDMEELIQQHILESSKKQEVIIHRRMLKELQKQQKKTFREELFNALLESNFPKTRSKAAVSYVLEELGNELDFDRGLELAKEYLKETAPKTKKKKKIDVLSEEDLRKQSENNQESSDSYNDIKRKGYIPDINQELGI